MTSDRYPLDTALTVRKRKQTQPGLLDIRIAVLGGATTSEVLARLDSLVFAGDNPAERAIRVGGRE